MRRDQKKHQKEKKREKKNAERKKHADSVAKERHRRNQYPEVVVDSTNADPEFEGAVRNALATIDFDDPALFTMAEREFYKFVRERGSGYAFAWARSLFEPHSFDKDQREITLFAFQTNFGTRLLERIPEDVRRRTMPYNDVRVDFVGRKLVLKFSSLLKEKGTGGTIYFSWRKPKVEIDGKEWTIAFSGHAIQRICERINPRYIEYLAAGDVYALFSDCVYVEPVLLHGGHPAFAVYEACAQPLFAAYAVYVEGILGKENVDPAKGKCYYRVGYCPIVFEREFAKAKTLLYPGYTGTPEYGLILKAKLSREERQRMIDATKSLDAHGVILENHEIIKWFHDNGIPQVVQMTRQVFAPLDPIGDDRSREVHAGDAPP